MLDLLKKQKVNVFELDTGNALFRAPGLDDAPTRQRAAFVLQTMGKLGVQVMVAADRDLNAGASFLAEQAQKAKVKVVSANLTEGGKRVFEPSAVFTAGGVKLGVVGLTAPGPVSGHAELVGGELAKAARPELQKLKGKVDVLVLVASMPYLEALKLSTELKGLPDVILQSGEVHGTGAAQALDGGGFLMGSGQKGQVMARLELKLDGKGPLIDLGDTRRDKEELAHLDSQVKQLEERAAKITDPKVKQDFNRTYDEIRARRDQQQAKLSAAQAPDARTLDLDWIILDDNVADDPSVKAEVLKVEPTYAGQH